MDFYVREKKKQKKIVPRYERRPCSQEAGSVFNGLAEAAQRHWLVWLTCWVVQLKCTTVQNILCNLPDQHFFFMYWSVELNDSWHQQIGKPGAQKSYPVLNNQTVSVFRPVVLDWWVMELFQWLKEKSLSQKVLQCMEAYSGHTSIVLILQHILKHGSIRYIRPSLLKQHPLNSGQLISFSLWCSGLLFEGAETESWQKGLEKLTANP